MQTLNDEIIPGNFRKNIEIRERGYGNLKTPVILDKTIMGIGCDVKKTDRKRNRRFMLRSEENHKALMEKWPYPILIHDGNVLLYSNSYAVHLYEFSSPEEMVGLEIMNLIHPDDRRFWDDGIQTIIRADSYFTPKECRIIKKNGSVAFTEITETLCRYKGKKAVQSILKDITKRKEMEKALLESQQRLKNLTEATFEGIGFSENGIIMDVNEQLAEMLFSDRKSLIGKAIVDFVAPESKELVLSMINSNIEGSYEFWARRTDGSVFPSEVRARREKIGGKQILVSAIRDLTERKETDRRILNAIIDAEERERNRFSCELHDGLGPMLTTLKLYFEWLAETPPGKKRKNIAEKGNQYFNEAIHTLQEISNNLSPRGLNNLGVISAITDFIQRLNETDRIKIEFKFNFKHRFEKNIEITLYRIITELINNTIKYAQATSIKIILSFDCINSKIMLLYSDNGKGFIVNEVFNNNKGLGLMNITQRINTLDGKLNIKSNLGKGIKVKIEFPANCL